MIVFLEWLGACFGIAGAALLSSNIRTSPWGWVLFLVSSISLCLYAALVGAWGLLALNACFVATNITGIFRCFLPYRRDHATQTPA